MGGRTENIAHYYFLNQKPLNNKQSDPTSSKHKQSGPVRTDIIWITNAFWQCWHNTHPVSGTDVQCHSDGPNMLTTSWFSTIACPLHCNWRMEGMIPSSTSSLHLGQFVAPGAIYCHGVQQIAPSAINCPRSNEMLPVQ